MNRFSSVCGVAARRWLFSAVIFGCFSYGVTSTAQAQQQQIKVPTVEDLLASSVSEANSLNYPEVHEAIRRFFIERDVIGARGQLQVAVEKSSKLPPAEILMAQLLATAQQGPMARSELELGVKKALALKAPVDPEFYLIFGDIAFQERRFTDAELLFAKAEAALPDYRANPKRADAMKRRAFAGEAAVCEAREDWTGAQKKLNAWLSSDDNSAAAHQRMGRTLFKDNKVAEALAEFQKAAKAEKNMLPAEIMMGRLYEEADDHKSAADQMKVAIDGLKNVSDNQQYTNICLAVAQWAVATAYKDQKLLVDAKKYADLALAKDSSNLETRIVSGLIARLNNDLPAAEAHFEKARDLSPANFAAVNNLALVLADGGAAKKDTSKLKRALELATVNARQYPQNAEAVATLGWVLYKNDQKDEARRYIAAVAQSGNVTPDAAYYVAQLLYDNKEYEQAKTILDQALNGKQPFAMRSPAESLSNLLKAEKKK